MDSENAPNKDHNSLSALSIDALLIGQAGGIGIGDKASGVENATTTLRDIVEDWN